MVDGKDENESLIKLRHIYWVFTFIPLYLDKFLLRNCLHVFVLFKMKVKIKGCPKVHLAD